MAPLVPDMDATTAHPWLQLLSPFPGRFEFALRLAIICALTALAVEIYQTPSPALTIYLVFFLNKADRMGSVIASLALIVVISVVIALLFPLAATVIDYPPMRVASMALISFIMLFLASASKLKPIGGTVALIAAYALDLLGSMQIGELATRALLYAWLFVAIPAGVSICVNLLSAPAPRRLAEATLARRLRIVACLLASDDATTRRRLSDALEEGNGDLLKHLKMARLDKSLTATHAAALTRAALTSFEMLALVDAMEMDKVKFPVSLSTRLSVTLDQMAAMLDEGAYPVEIDCPEPDPAEHLTAAAAEIFHAFEIALPTFALAPGESAGPSGHGEQERKGTAKRGFFLHDAFSNPDHIRHALKVTAAAMTSYMLFQILDWPGIHTALITCYIVSLGTTAETVEKLSLRIAGCLIGAVAGIATLLFVMPGLTSIGGLMIVVFIGAFPAAWIAVGSPRIAYAGYQIIFAFLLCVVQGSSPDFDMTVARDRVIGVLLGNFLTYLIFVNVWPVSIADKIDHIAARLLREMAGMLGSNGALARRTMAGQARETLSTLVSDLELVGYEPLAIRPPDGWVANRRRVVTDLSNLYRATLVAGAVGSAGSGALARECEEFADWLAPGDASSGIVAPAWTAPSEKHGARSHFLDAATILMGRVKNDFCPEDSEATRGCNAIT